MFPSLALGAVVALSVALPARGAAQARIDRQTSVRVAVNDDVERYLRVLQVAGLAAYEPWTVRGFSPVQVRHLVGGDTRHPMAAHPWRARLAPSPVVEPGPGLATDVLAPEARVYYNTRFPFGYNDGAVWAGRGLTSAVQFGGALRAGLLTAAIEPVVFRAENTGFPLVPNGQTGRLAFADVRGTAIDLPQRFGDGAYQRVDLGQSVVRVDAFGLALGVSTANQHWGPALENPILLGNNAAGYEHLFAGTSRPVDVKIGTVHGRFVWGRLDQSDFAVLEGRTAKRFTSGIVGAFTPRGAPGLEIGAGRFFHQLWPEGGPTVGDFFRPLGAFTQTGRARQVGDSGIEADNQLASVWFRWVFTGSGFEAYAEYGRDDRNFDSRDLMVEPDHDAAYLIGFQKVWRRRENAVLTVLRGEVLNSRITHIQLVRPEAPFYVHGSAIQGHTQLGQVLGSVGGYGGGASVIAVDRYTPQGRWTVSWSRIMRGEQPVPPTNVPMARGADVAHALGLNALLLRGSVDLTAGLTGVYEYNRDFAGDSFNANLALGARAHW